MRPGARELRLGSGLVVGAFVFTHLLNHGLGLVSLHAMEAFRRAIEPVWQSPPGAVLLYGSLAVHAWLAFRSLYRRRTMRMPAWEAWQLASGLLVPLLLAKHVVGTRVSEALLGFDVDYQYVVAVLWSAPALAVQQSLLVLLVWTHFCLGLHFWLRLRAWYARALPLLYPLAVLVPVIALLGFGRAGMEVSELLAQPGAQARIFAGWLAAGSGERVLVANLASGVPIVFYALLALLLAARALRSARSRRRRVRVDHPRGSVNARVGQTVLEALRAGGVPHASVCGGRGRCTTCRIRVDHGAAALDPPSELEAAALRRIGAVDRVRLACQVRPRQDIGITPLVLAAATARDAYSAGGVQGREQQVVMMFVDLRGSTRLGEQRLPYDVVYILNQFFAEMSAALAATEGHYAQFSGDGLLALYGLRGDIGVACRQAFAGAAEMTRRLGGLNRRLASELDEPLRMGIGIHCGEAIVGTMGPPASPNVSAIGDNVNVAARLEAMTKDLDCPLVASLDAVARAGIDASALPRHDAVVRGRAEPVTVVAVADPVAMLASSRGADPGVRVSR